MASDVTTETNMIDSIVLSGGGLNGILMLGAIQHSMDANLFNMSNIDMLVGTSIGSLICYLLAIGYFPTEVMCLLAKYQEELNIMTNKFSMMKMMKLEGGMSFTHLQYILEQITLNKTGTLFTLKSLYERYNKTLVCVTYNFTTQQIEYMSHENYPDLPCILAIRMSCSIPVIFEKCMFNGNHYIDGGVYDNLAIQYPLLHGKKYPIAFNILFKYHSIENGTLTLKLYLYELYKILVNSGNHYKCELFADKAKIIQIHSTKTNILWTSTITIKDILELFSDGYALLKE